ncbi:unnamed protein product, partial [Thlaspi arvense]
METNLLRNDIRSFSSCQKWELVLANLVFQDFRVLGEDKAFISETVSVTIFGSFVFINSVNHQRDDQKVHQT